MKRSYEDDEGRGGIFAHIDCVLYMPPTYFQNGTRRENVMGISKIHKDRKRLKCHICGVAHDGACVQCSSKECLWACHVSCAVELNRLALRKEDADDEEVKKRSLVLFSIGDSGMKDRAQHCLYCPVHNPSTEGFTEERRDLYAQNKLLVRASVRRGKRPRSKRLQEKYDRSSFSRSGGSSTRKKGKRELSPTSLSSSSHPPSRKARKVVHDDDNRRDRRAGGNHRSGSMRRYTKPKSIEEYRELSRLLQKKENRVPKQIQIVKLCQGLPQVDWTTIKRSGMGNAVNKLKQRTNNAALKKECAALIDEWLRTSYERYKEKQEKKAAENVARKPGRKASKFSSSRSQEDQPTSSTSSTSSSSGRPSLAKQKEPRLKKAIAKFLEDLKRRSPDRKINPNRMYTHLRDIGLAENLSNVSDLEPGDIKGVIGLKLLDARAFCKTAQKIASP